MKPVLLENETKVHCGKTLHRLYWPDTGKDGGWATKQCVFPFNTTVRVSGEANLMEGYFLGGTIQGGTFWGGRFIRGRFLGGLFRGGLFRGGSFYGGTYYGGYFHQGIFHGGEFHGGEFTGGLFEGGTYHGGSFHGGIHRRSPVTVQRSDGYVFTLYEDEGEIKVTAGCRHFTWEEAQRHWGASDHPHHAETMRILNFLFEEHQHQN